LATSAAFPILYSDPSSSTATTGSTKSVPAKINRTPSWPRLSVLGQAGKQQWQSTKLAQTHGPWTGWQTTMVEEASFHLFFISSAFPHHSASPKFCFVKMPKCTAASSIEITEKFGAYIRQLRTSCSLHYFGHFWQLQRPLLQPFLAV
jgi:hypothetical protein